LRIYVYGKPRDVTAGFEDYLNRAKTAVISIEVMRAFAVSRTTHPQDAIQARRSIKMQN
jgi:hypothetical protein